MGVAKFTYYGTTVFDISQDTVDAAHLVKNYTAHGADGEPIVGTYEGQALPVLTNPAQASDIKSGLEAIDGNGAKINGTFAGQTKEATPSPTQQNITPDAGKYLSSVTVKAIQTETKSVAPATTAQEVTATSGKYMTKVTVSAIPYTETQLPNGGTAVTIGV